MNQGEYIDRRQPISQCRGKRYIISPRPVAGVGGNRAVTWQITERYTLLDGKRGSTPLENQPTLALARERVAFYYRGLAFDDREARRRAAAVAAEALQALNQSRPINTSPTVADPAAAEEV